MNTSAIALPHWQRAVRFGRVRSLFGGLGFLFSVCAFATLQWTIEYVLASAPTIGLAQALLGAGLVFKLNLMITVPPQPIVVALINLAPPSGLRRYALYCLIVVSTVLWCIYLEPHGAFSGEWTDGVLHHGRWLAGILDSATALMLLTISLGYFRTAANASDVLARARVDEARLDSELQSARLQLLQAQIEPHFLLNAIANVRTLARLQPEAAVDLIDNLGRYFSAALPHIREGEARLSDEMRLVDAYLAIYRVRMGTRLSYELDLPPDLAPVRVPTMILLTLVENAVKHGITPAVEGGFIRVTAARDGSALELKVADSGCGLKPGQGGGSGLVNSRTRLRLQYGEQATLQLERAEPRGVIATVRIPLQRLS